jgi:hypothetical protein
MPCTTPAGTLTPRPRFGTAVALIHPARTEQDNMVNHGCSRLLLDADESVGEIPARCRQN